jgi:KaiC/GvpD/RAD55 family RecA-like ATPase
MGGRGRVGNDPRFGMSSAVRLPSELRQFLQLPGPQSLIIRGPPGSGKTTLGLALLEASGGDRILISNRVGLEELGREFPWLGENGTSRIQLVDASDLDVPLEGLKRAVTNSTMIQEPDSSERRRLLDFIALPPAIQDAWSRLPPDAPSTVVVDSWDALIEHFLGRHRVQPDFATDRPEVERLLLQWMGRSRTHLILILETDQQSQLDYLVNGVIVTRREFVNDRLERWLHLPKLRGIRIANASYPYTVEGAKFQCIEPLRPYVEIRRGHVDPEPDPLPGFIWPGSKSFAEAFGRLAVGRLTLLEVEDDVPDYVVNHLLTPAKFHTVKSGGRVLLIPSPGLSADEIWEPMEGSRPAAHLSEGFRVLDVSGQLERALKGGRPERLASLISIKSLPPPSEGRDPDDNEISRWLKGGVAGGHPPLVSMFGAGLESLAATMKIPLTPEVLATLPASIQSTLGTGIHLIAVGRPDSAMFRQFRSLAMIHLRILNRQGRVLLYGLKPWTTGFVMAEPASTGPYDLLRIV